MPKSEPERLGRCLYVKRRHPVSAFQMLRCEPERPGCRLQKCSRVLLCGFLGSAGATLPFAEPRTGDGRLPEGDAAIVYRHRAGDKRAQAFCP